MKFEQIEQELAEVRQELEQLSQPQPLTPEEWAAARLARVRAENERLLPLIEKALGKMDTKETMSAEQIQQMIAADGVKPEENSFSRGIIEMREGSQHELLLAGCERACQAVRS
ncbi:hypothetical protein HYR99_32325 [Candidatus Poribacteria bacterium]|nr:hypothetical protein [Candidatus Poribacteria bacterium]